jgi:energy-coupling factor transport system permease protein
LFLVPDFWGFAIAGGLMMLIILFSGISLKVVLRGLKPLMFIIVFTAFFNILYGGGEPLFPTVSWLAWIKADGVRNALFMIVRIILLILGTSYLTYTTSPVMLTDAMERLLRPLKVFKLPVHELAMMMTIALRFIPTLIDETDKIINAQKARGADFETGNIFRRAKALIPILIPLLISAFRRAEELADAMECRCYHGGAGRTRYKVYSLGWRDYLALVVMAAALAGIILLIIF